MEEIENKIGEEEPKKKVGRGQTKERMMELHKIRSEKALLRRKEQEELKNKEEEIKNIKKEKIEAEYEEVKKIKEAIEKKKNKNKKKIIEEEEEEEEEEIKKINHQNTKIIKSASRDILKEKYLEEAKRRIMMDLFS